MPLLETLTDEFNAALDGTQWGGWGGPTTSAGRLAMPVIQAYSGLTTWAQPYDFRDSRIVLANVECPPNGPSNSNEFKVMVRWTGAPDAETHQCHIKFGGGTLGTQVVNNGTIANGASVAYNATTHAWWRISSTAAGVLTFATSPDGATWSALGPTLTATWDVSTVKVQFVAGHYVAGADSTAYVGAVNPVTAPPPSATNVRFGASPATGLRVGSVQVGRAYLGSSLVWGA